MKLKLPNVKIVILAATVAIILSARMSSFADLPLPKHGVEGYGGTFSTYSAYLVNPSKESPAGLPAMGGIFVYMGEGRNLSSVTFTETLFGRLELGYGYNRFDMGDLPDAINDAVGIRIHDNDGFDYTLYTSKMITFLGRPIILNAGLRSSEAAHLGLLGFTGERESTGEGSICFLATDKIIFAAEYRQKPDEYRRIPGLVEDEDDWWTSCAGSIFNDHCSAAIGYGHFGDVLNHTANRSIGGAIKYEF